MEFGRDVIDALEVGASSSNIDDGLFSALLSTLPGYVLNTADKSASETQYDGPKKQVMLGLSSLFVECARMDSSTDEIRSLLEECQYDNQRASLILKSYSTYRSSLRSTLARITSLDRARVVDVNWRLQYNIKNNQGEKVDQLSYLVSLQVIEPGDDRVKDVTFTCSLEQLQDLVGKLKDAVRCVERQTS